MKTKARYRRNKVVAAWIFGLSTFSYAATASAMVTGALADTIADWLSVIVLLVLPPAGIYLFWMLHILPEKAAHKRHHAQKDAIHMMCLLSLVFGGLLWPIAMLWAYIKPMGMRIAVVEPEHLHPTPPSAQHPAAKPNAPAAGETG
jgi:hypothetical protein